MTHLSQPGNVAGRLLTRARSQVDDWIRGSRLVGDSIALAWLTTSRITRGASRAGALPPRPFQQAMRFSRSRLVRQFVRSEYQRWWAAKRTESLAPQGKERQSVRHSTRPIELASSLILKKPVDAQEKGVLFLGTEGDWERLISSGHVAAIKQRFHLFAMAASAAPPLRRLHVLATSGDGPLHFGIGNADHYGYVSVLGDAVKPVSIMGCDWLEPDAFSPRPRAAREIDIIVVASWLRLKRHWLVFKALKALPSDLHVVFVGAPAEGRTIHDIKREARDWGVRQHIDFRESIPNDEVYALQCNAKIALQLTRREGPCVAVVEALMADTPVAMMDDSYAGASRYINDQTGVFLERASIGRMTRTFLDAHERYQPREWIRQRASFPTSLRELEAHFRAAALERGEPWRESLLPVTRRYQKLRYANPADASRVADAVVEFTRAYDIRLG